MKCLYTFRMLRYTWRRSSCSGTVGCYNFHDNWQVVNQSNFSRARGLVLKLAQSHESLPSIHTHWDLQTCCSGPELNLTNRKFVFKMITTNIIQLCAKLHLQYVLYSDRISRITIALRQYTTGARWWSLHVSTDLILRDKRIMRGKYYVQALEQVDARTQSYSESTVYHRSNHQPWILDPNNERLKCVRSAVVKSDSVSSKIVSLIRIMMHINSSLTCTAMYRNTTAVL